MLNLKVVEISHLIREACSNETHLEWRSWGHWYTTLCVLSTKNSILETLHRHGIDISVWPECMASSTLFRGPNTWKPHSKRSRLYERSQPITVYRQQCVLNSVGRLLCNMTALLVSMTQHARTLLLGGVKLWVQQKWCGEMVMLGFLNTA